MTQGLLLCGVHRGGRFGPTNNSSAFARVSSRQDHGSQLRRKAPQASILLLVLQCLIVDQFGPRLNLARCCQLCTLDAAIIININELLMKLALLLAGPVGI